MTTFEEKEIKQDGDISVSHDALIRVAAKVLQRASIDYLIGLPYVWEWLKSEEAAAYFDVLGLCQEKELKLLVKQKSKIRRGKNLVEINKLIKKESEAIKKEIRIICREIGYNISERYKKK